MRLEHKFVRFHVENQGKDVVEQRTGGRASTEKNHTEEEEQGATSFINAVRTIRFVQQTKNEQIDRNETRTDEERARLFRIEKFVLLKDFEEFVDHHRRRWTRTDRQMSNDRRRRRRRNERNERRKRIVDEIRPQLPFQRVVKRRNDRIRVDLRI